MSRRTQAVADMLSRGLAAHRAGRLDMAEQAYRAVLNAAPAHPDALHLLGMLADQRGRPDIAADLLGQAVLLRPKAAPYHAALANALVRQGRLEEAVAHYQEALWLKPDTAEVYTNLGNALIDLGRTQEAITAHESAVRLRVDAAGFRENLALALADAYRLEEAEQELRAVLRSAPDDATIHSNLGNVLRAAGRLPESEAELRNAVELRPDVAEYRYNLAETLLLSGNLADGWREFESRWGLASMPALRTHRPRWQGEALDGRTLLIHAEQGFGDTIQFCRFVAPVAAQAGVVLEVPQPLTRLLASLPHVATIVAAGEALPEHDLFCPLLSLPRLLGVTTPEAIPAAPYLTANPVAVAAWQARLAQCNGLHVGLAWRGNPQNARMDRRRSIAPERLAALGGLPGITFVSLQKDAPAPAIPGLPLHDWTNELTDFADTAALIEALDLVVGVDTAVVHLAGALGRPAWLLNRFDTCWRWLIGRDDSPWYPTLRLFRQDQPGDWDGVLTRVRAALSDLSGRTGSQAQRQMQVQAGAGAAGRTGGPPA